jgi:hypothetical protein
MRPLRLMPSSDLASSSSLGLGAATLIKNSAVLPESASFSYEDAGRVRLQAGRAPRNLSV